MMNAKYVSRNFLRSEFACRCGCGFDTVDAQTVEIVQAVRDHFGVPFDINSGCRCPTHNAAVGGAPGSQHVKARAADIDASQSDVKPDAVADFVIQHYPSASVGRYNTFTHIDTRTRGPDYWDKRT
jgi:uncharacterized protein YcbK (DUF882 family)